MLFFGRTIQLSDVVDGRKLLSNHSHDPDSKQQKKLAFDIHHKVSKGKLSIQQLDTIFGTSVHEEAIKKVLRDGNLKGTADEEKNSKNPSTKNEARGSRFVDTRGSGPTGI